MEPLRQNIRTALLKYGPNEMSSVQKTKVRIFSVWNEQLFSRPGEPVRPLRKVLSDQGSVQMVENQSYLFPPPPPTWFYCIATMNLSENFRKTDDIPLEAQFLKIKQKPLPPKILKIFVKTSIGEFPMNYRQTAGDRYLNIKVSDNSHPTLLANISFKTR